MLTLRCWVPTWIFATRLLRGFCCLATGGLKCLSLAAFVTSPASLIFTLSSLHLMGLFYELKIQITKLISGAVSSQSVWWRIDYYSRMPPEMATSSPSAQAEIKKKLYTELEILAFNKSTIVVYAGIDKCKQTLLSLWWLWDDEDISLHIYQGNKCQDEA